MLSKEKKVLSHFFLDQIYTLFATLVLPGVVEPVTGTILNKILTTVHPPVFQVNFGQKI